MGQRHQLFVIAKIANRYRGLAVFHHQWLYGATALKRCLGILSIFSAPSNRLPIQQELTAARRFDDDFWTKERSWKDIEVPFPFITTSLLLGASFDVKEGYNASVILQPFNIAFNDGDNNDGITIIDITDLTHLRYCFVLWGDCDVFHSTGAEVEEVREEEQVTGWGSIPQMTPLSGPTYLSAYYNVEERSTSTDFQALVQQYEAWDLIDVASLADTWPQGKWLVAEAEIGVAADISLTARPAPSLRETALARLVDTSLQNADSDLSWITEAELLSDFLPAIKKRLYSEPTLLASPAAKVLLLKAVEHETAVDLSPFQDLSMDEVLSITSRLSKKTTSLSLSRNVTSGLLALLAEKTSLRKIYALDAPKLQLRSVLRVMHQHKSTSIYHANMFRAPFRDQTAHSPEDEQRPPTDTADLLTKAGERFPVVQIFWLSRELRTNGNVSRLDDGGLPWATLLPPSDQDPYLVRFHVSLAAFPLHDAFLPTTRVVTGLVNFMQCLAQSRDLGLLLSKEGTVGMVAAKCFALAISDPAELAARQVEVGPLPAQLFTTARKMNASTAGPPAPEVQPLRPGEWTIILAHEPRDVMAKYENRASKEKLRYAFVTAPSTEESCREAASATSDVVKAGRAPIIADMKTFLDRVTEDDPSAQDRLLAFWNEATNGLTDEFKVCGKEEIASILEVMPEYSMRRKPQLRRWLRWSGMGH